MEDVEFLLNKVNVKVDTINVNKDQDLNAIRKEITNAHSKNFQIAETVITGNAGRIHLKNRDIGKESNCNHQLVQDRRKNSRMVGNRDTAGDSRIVGMSGRSSTKRRTERMCT